MDEMLRLRCLNIASWMLEKRATVRQAAQHFGISKSSVHKDMCARLPHISPLMARQVAALMRYNKSVRHLRGGAATRLRYMAEK